MCNMNPRAALVAGLGAIAKFRDQSLPEGPSIYYTRPRANYTFILDAVYQTLESLSNLSRLPKGKVSVSCWASMTKNDSTLSLSCEMNCW